MRILILTVGTRGDVQPYVALGKGLVAAGHTVTICTCARFEGFVARHGLGYAHLNNELLDFMHTDEGKAAMENTGNIWELIRTGIKLFPKMGAIIARQIEDMWQAVKAVRPDLILFHKKALGAEDFAEKLDIPCALAFYLPLYASTGEFPAMGFPHLRLGSWYNRRTYQIVDWVTQISTRKFIRPWRQEHGLPSRGSRYARSGRGTPTPVLHAFSPSVIPEPADWPPTATTTGYWFLDEENNWSPPLELTQFLDAGSTPIYVGFGSIFGRSPARTTQIILRAIEQAGVRAVLASGWGGLDVTDHDLPANVKAIEAAPHEWLFPRIAAVIHHGGCGTTAAGLRAGKPTIICPFFGDQPFWGHKIHELGAGPQPIPQKRLSPENLSNAIRQTLDDQQMRENAAALGARIQSENGVQTAVKFIEKLFPQTK